MTDLPPLTPAPPPQSGGLASVRAAASMAPGSYSKADNSIGVIWNTGAIMAQYGTYPNADGGFTRGAYDIQLSMDEGAYDLTSLNNHAPFLDNHAYDDLGMVNMTNRSVVGKVIPGSAEIVKGNGVARVMLSTAAGDADLVTKLITNIIANVSVGVKPKRVTRLDKPEDNRARPLFRADLWEPYEISAVPLGADPGAHTFAKAQEPVPMTTVHAPAVDETEIRRAERERCAAINARFAIVAKRTDDVAEKAINDRLLASLIDGGASVAEAGVKILDRLAEMDAKFGVSPAQPTSLTASRVEVGSGEKQARGKAVEAWLMHRAGAGPVPTDNDNRFAREYRGSTLVDICRSSLVHAGVDVSSMGRDEIADMALSVLGRDVNSRVEFMHVRASGGGAVGVDNLPYLLANTANKLLRQGYGQVPPTYKTWAKQGPPLADYKTRSAILLGDFAEFEELPEGATPRRSDIVESNVTMQAKDYARAFAVTRKAIVNDDLRGFTEAPMKFGQGASRKENALAYAQLIASGNYTSANTGTAGAPSSTTLSELRKLMRKRTTGVAATGETARALNITPKILVVPPNHETAAQALRATLYPQTTSDAKDNQFADLVIVTDSALSDDNKWYVVADPMIWDGIHYSYLAGENGVVMSSEVEFGSGSLIMQARLAFDVKVIDNRALGYNAGA